MDIHKVISLAVLILLVCFSVLWGARLIQDDGTLPVQKQTTQSTNTAQTNTPSPAKMNMNSDDQGPGTYLPNSTLQNKTPASSVAQPTRQPKTKNTADSGGQFITMDFDGVDIKVFIKFIADITGKNFIIDDKVTGKVTVISPRKMTLDEAYRVFLSVLEVNGFGTVDMG